jgi:hypothetical protein
MSTYSIDPLYPHWFRCDLCHQDVAEVLPAEALDLVNLTAGQVLELCPEAEAEIVGHEHDCPAVALAADPVFPKASTMLLAPAYPTVDESFTRLHRAGWSIGETGTAKGWLVTGHSGENFILAQGATQKEAWHRGG